MADVNVTFGYVDEGLSNAVNNIRSNLAGSNGLTQSLTNAGNAARQSGINFEAMIERMAVRMAIMFAFREIIKQIADAIKEAATAEEDFLHIQNMNMESTAKTEERFSELKQIADETGQDLEKTVIPAFVKLRESGMMPDEALQETRVINAELEKTGVNLTDIAAKAKIGTLGFADIAKAAAGLQIPQLGEWANGVMQMEQAEKQYNQELEHTHQLTERTIQDQERLGQAHEQFAAKTGLAQSAFKAFQTAGARPTAFATIPTALADLPGGTHAFSQLLGDMQKKFQQGIQQIAKEENLPLRTIQMAVRGGLAGFDEQSLLAAQRRSVEEWKITDTR